MPPSQTIATLQALIQGRDPASGVPLPAESVLHRAEVLRALLAAVSALEQSAQRAQRRAQLPENVGRSWSETEQAALVAGFEAGESPAALAAKHGRTLRAIEARLERLGLLRPEQRTTRGDFAGVSDAPSRIRSRRTRSPSAARSARRARH